MRRCGRWLAGLFALSLSLCVPSTAEAQSGFAGVVRDETGAVLPGVTVEASSAVLIEKVRTAVTDNAGLYRIVDLRPGVYALTFTLPGFTTVKREGVELPASFTATVNAEMRAGGIEETITVSGTAPTVDVQSVASATVLSSEILNAAPVLRFPQTYAATLTGVTGAALGAAGRETRSLAIHGSRGAEAQVAIDGSKTFHIMLAGGSSDIYYINPLIVDELSVETGTFSAEHGTAGIVSNVIPKEGSNAYRGSLFGSYTNEHLRGDNLDENLRGRGLTANPGIQKLSDFNGAFGGRIVRDRLWFFSAVRQADNRQYVAGVFYDVDPADWVYTPDLSRPVVSRIFDKEVNTRLTWQLTPRNKISGFYAVQPHFLFNRNITGGLAGGGVGARVTQEATTYTPYLPNIYWQLSWKAPLTSRVLIAASVARHYADVETRRQTDPPVPNDRWSATELSTNTIFRAASIISSPVTPDYGSHEVRTHVARVSASYVTGSHTFKAGLDQVWGSLRHVGINTNGDLSVTLLNSVPRSLTLAAYPLDNANDVNWDLGLYAQDRWTYKRLTADVGLRYDYFNSSVPEQHLPAGRFVAARDYPPARDVPNWKDVSPRLGASYDLFGNGKTAIKGFAGRYLQGWGANFAAANNPVHLSVTNVTRTWNDANADYVPDCNLASPLANGECGQISDLNFGKANSRASRYDDNVLRGSGKRTFNWETSLAIQHELVPRVSVSVGYYRRSYGNFLVTDNLAVAPAEYDPFCITAPVDSRLPDGGGNQICGLYDINRAKFGLVNNLITFAKPFGTQREVYDGVDVNFTTRFPNGIQFSGGSSTGRVKTNRCFVVDSPGELRFCDINPPLQTQFKLIGSFPLPWWGLQVGSVVQSLPGPQITADYVATNAEIRPSLGRDLSAGSNGTVTVPLIRPGTVYWDRSTQVDLRVTKSFRIGRARLLPSLDLFNVFNANGIQALQPRYGPTWQDARMIQGARYVQFTGQIDF